MSRKEKLVQYTRQKVLRKGKHLSFDQIPKSSFKPNFLDKLFQELEVSASNQKIPKQSKGDFVQNYKNNLRKTIYNETKVMLRTKKQKHQNMQRIAKSNFKSPVPMFQQKSKKSHSDSLYKTIISKRSTNLKKRNNFQLGVNKFPLVIRKNVAKLDDSFNMRMYQEREKKFENKKRKSNFTFEKQDIQPWETMQPNF